MLKISVLNALAGKSMFVNFNGKTEDFWRDYYRTHGDIPLKTAIVASIGDERNFLGEGFDKKGYLLSGNDDYVVRVYKRTFNDSDLERDFVKPQRTFLDSVDGVVLKIPGKVDIVKRKRGVSLGVEDYARKVAPPLENIPVSREETLRSLKTYEALKDFPISAYVAAYKQIKAFSRKKGYQFDIINPNNILIDTERKKINLIDPMDPKINKCEKGAEFYFAPFHGADSLYPVLCDFLMQKEHLKNLTQPEQKRWKKAINDIVIKSIVAGKRVGYNRSVEPLGRLYRRIDTIWDMNNGVSKRYNSFLNLYSSAVNYDRLVDIAVDYKNGVVARRKAIQQLSPINIKDLRPAIEKIFEAPHQPKVEVPEILNVVIDKMAEYGSGAKSVLSTIYPLFEKELFYPTKRRIYDLFIAVNPTDKKFLAEMEKSANNIFERTLYKEQFIHLYRSAIRLPINEAHKVKKIAAKALDAPELPQDLVNKLWISRTCVNSGPEQLVSIDNMKRAYGYINEIKHRLPKINDMVYLHKMSLEDAPGQEKIMGLVRSPETEELFWQGLKIKVNPKKTVNPYMDTKDVPAALVKLENHIRENHDKVDTFKLASDIFSDIVYIHPFYNGNGRAARLFTEQFLLFKGYKLMKWPEETLYRNICSREEMAERLRECSVRDV